MLSILLMENHESESFLAVQRRKTIPTVINFSYLTTCKFDFLAPIYLTQALFMQLYHIIRYFLTLFHTGVANFAKIYVLKIVR